MQLDELLSDLFKTKVLGNTVAHLYVIEFQKRGLPHAHILVFFAPGEKVVNSDMIDDVVCAEFPDPTRFEAGSDERVAEERLLRIVLDKMMHGPCGKDSKFPCSASGK